ncbi:hypothetical protein [Paraglaciecola mesophila]|nr:hypothetical protein [Paraglaciecola mesophila]
MRDSQHRKYWPAAELPVTRKDGMGRLDLALFSSKRTVLVECKQLRMAIRGKSFSRVQTRLDNASNQLRDIYELESIVGSTFIKKIDKVAMVSIAGVMPIEKAELLNDSEKEEMFWDKFEALRAEFKKHMISGVYLGQHHINGKIDLNTNCSKQVSIGQFFVLMKL